MFPMLKVHGHWGDEYTLASKPGATRALSWGSAAICVVTRESRLRNLSRQGRGTQKMLAQCDQGWVHR